ncbi:hypothetical protein EIMP300_72410 [Escherichia coli]|uniref:Cation efflux system protein n=1 Tax=Escherichia coli TaxID=562 RepID=A0A8S0G0R0_ECOLX|nr:hypothetical protein EIMP300_72410 [Escherichia coli]
MITDASVEVGPALFISLLIITLSFIPIFTLEGQEGRLFGPLAFTKTYAMAGAALLAIVVIPILMGYWIRGKIPPESSNPLNRFLIRVYHPLLLKVLHWPKTTLLVAALSVLTVLWPLNKVGGEFLPQINEGDLLYMPSANAAGDFRSRGGEHAAKKRQADYERTGSGAGIWQNRESGNRHRFSSTGDGRNDYPA